MSDVKGLESAVVEAENRVKSLMERSNSLGGNEDDGSMTIDEAREYMRNRGTVGPIAENSTEFNRRANASISSEKKSSNMTLVFGGIAVVAVLGYLVLRKKK